MDEGNWKRWRQYREIGRKGRKEKKKWARGPEETSDAIFDYTTKRFIPSTNVEILLDVLLRASHECCKIIFCIVDSFYLYQTL